MLWIVWVIIKQNFLSKKLTGHSNFVIDELFERIHIRRNSLIVFKIANQNE